MFLVVSLSFQLFFKFLSIHIFSRVCRSEPQSNDYTANTTATITEKRKEIGTSKNNGRRRLKGEEKGVTGTQEEGLKGGREGTSGREARKRPSLSLVKPLLLAQNMWVRRSPAGPRDL